MKTQDEKNEWKVVVILGKSFLTGRSASPSVVSFCNNFGVWGQFHKESSECQELETRNSFFSLQMKIFINFFYYGRQLSVCVFF